MNLFTRESVCFNLPAPPQTGAAGCRVAWWGEVWWPTSTPARRSEHRCPPAWRSAGSERTVPARPSPVSSGRSSSPGPASSPSGWNSALRDRGHSLTNDLHIIINTLCVCVHVKFSKSSEIWATFYYWSIHCKTNSSVIYRCWNYGLEVCESLLLKNNLKIHDDYFPGTDF